MGDLERLSRLHPVSKVLQQESWDCGLACVCMILRAFGQATCTVAKLERQAQTSSIWTIDLAFLLHRNLPHADFTYYTACVGVNPEHTKNSFYSGLLDEDEQRVMQLFSRARAEMSVRIVEIAIPLLDLKRFLVHRQYVAVLLVDSAALKCIAGAGSRSGVLSWFSRRRWAKDGYLGHYILLFAFIPSLDVFLYRNPAIPEEFCLASAATINAARTRSGTDADCIILKL
ncbi:Guanylyl cyclase [Coemansia spiralis]|nr:Guanylyl cyclase [Coemansia spiralis]